MKILIASSRVRIYFDPHFLILIRFDIDLHLLGQPFLFVFLCELLLFPVVFFLSLSKPDQLRSRIGHYVDYSYSITGFDGIAAIDTVYAEFNGLFNVKKLPWSGGTLEPVSRPPTLEWAFKIKRHRFVLQVFELFQTIHLEFSFLLLTSLFSWLFSFLSSKQKNGVTEFHPVIDSLDHTLRIPDRRTHCM